jgi:hypothetical protein
VTAGTERCNGSYGEMVGSFPDDAWLVQGLRLSRYEGGRWHVRRRLPHHSLFLAAEGAGQALIALVPYEPEQPEFYRFLRVPEKRSAPLPRPTPKRGEPACRTRIVVPTAVARAADGTLFVFGNDCYESIPGSGKALAEVWKAGEAQPTLFELPDPLDAVPQLGAGAALVVDSHDVWVGGAQLGQVSPIYLAHFDGQRWTLVDAPVVKASVSSIARPSPEALWLTLSATPRALWRREAEGRWQEVALPADAGVPQRVLAHGNAIWVESERGIYRATENAPETTARPAAIPNLDCVDVSDPDEKHRLREP